MHQVTKSYRDLPAAHRQPKHDGHCRLIHGHNWGFDITFRCDELDENGFVIDVGKLSKVKGFLEDTFDHTLLLNEDDPLVEDDEDLSVLKDLAKIVVVPNCGMEGLGAFVFCEVNEICKMLAPRRGLVVSEVVVWEDAKNRSSYSE